MPDGGKRRADSQHGARRRPSRHQRFIQREGEVVHVIARHLFDLSAELASVGARDSMFPLPHGRGDEFHHGPPTPDPRGMPMARNLVDPYGHIDEIRVRTRDFR